MNKPALILAAFATLLAAPAALAAKSALTSQQQLDKLLAGRIAGKPVNCITVSDSHDMQVIDKTAIVYGSGSVIYVNRTSDPKALDPDLVLVHRSTGDGPCRLDTIQLHDRYGGSWRGFVVLEDFVPYRKAAKGS